MLQHSIHQQQHMLLLQQQQQLLRSSCSRRPTCVVSAAKRSFREANAARRAAAEQQQELRQTQQQQQQLSTQPPAAPAAKPHRRQQQHQQHVRSKTQKPDDKPAADALGCIHFGPCSGCTLDQGLWSPPILVKARQLFASHGVHDFQLQQGPVHGWRCRAKLAVRGTATDPQIGLFESGSHTLNPIPQCRAHHPRVNEGVQLVQQVTAGLRVQPYQDPQQQQQQRRGARDSSSSSSSGGYLRYLQLTALPSQAGGRAEEDAQAQVQLVIVWAAADASHPSFSDARRLAAALWAQGGPKTPNPLAALRARAEATAAAAAAAASSSSKKSSRSPPNPTKARGPAAGSSSSSCGTQPPPLLHSIWVNFQPHPDVNRVLGDTWRLMHGPETGWQGFGGVQLAVQPGSFVQANYGAMQSCLAAIAASLPKRCSVLELYAGSGVIGLSLCAAGVARRVVCVEVNPLARQPFDLSLARLAATDKEAAAKISHVTASAAEPDTLTDLLTQHYAAGACRTPPAAAAVDTAAAAADLPDVLIVDPPRKGLDSALMQLLTSTRSSSSSSSSSVLSGVTRLVYMSCGFEALAADTDLLTSAGWRVEGAQGFLFFPGTDTLETLAVFVRD